MAGVESNNIFDLLDEEVADSGRDEDSKPTKGAAAVRGKDKKTVTRGGHVPTQGPARGTGSRPAKREFDRHSGTGRGREVAKGGRGAHNWGSEANPADAVPDTTPVAPETVEENVEATADATAQDDNQKGFDDYLAMLAAKRPQDDQSLAPRAAIVDEKQFQKGVELQHQEEEPLFGDVVNQREKRQRSKNAKKNVVHLDSFVASLPETERPPREFNSESGRGRGGFRGGRGGFRGDHDGQRGRGRGGFRGGRGGRGGFDGQRDGQRGGFRGARGGNGDFRGRGRGGRGAQPENFLNDQNFPSLA